MQKNSPTRDYSTFKEQEARPVNLDSTFISQQQNSLHNSITITPQASFSESSLSGHQAHQNQTLTNYNIDHTSPSSSTLFLTILKDSSMISCSTIIAIGSSLFTILLAGHLKYPDTYITSIGNILTFHSFLTCGMMGMNSGFLIQSSRLFNSKSFSLLRDLKHAHVKLMIAYFSLFYIFNLVLFQMTQKFYEGNESVLMNQYIVLSIPGVILFLFNDANRSMIIAFGQFGWVFLLEILSLSLGCFVTYLITVTFDYGFIGVSLSLLITQAFLALFINLYLVFGEAFSEYRRKKDQVKQAALNVDRYWTKLFTYKGYLTYQIIFALQMILGRFWYQIDMIIASFLFDDRQMAANNVVFQLLIVIDLYGAGLASALSSKLGAHLMQGDIYLASKTYKYFMLQALIMGALVFLVLFFGADWLAYLSIEDSTVQTKLANLLRIFSFIAPFCLLSAVAQGTLRSINHEKGFVYIQLICAYMLHAVFVSLDLKVLDKGLSGIWASIGFSYFLIGALGHLVICKIDWTDIAMRIQDKKIEE